MRQMMLKLLTNTYKMHNIPLLKTMLSAHDNSKIRAHKMRGEIFIRAKTNDYLGNL